MADVLDNGYDLGFALRNLDRVLDGDAKSWWNHLGPRIDWEMEIGHDTLEIVGHVKEEFVTFFDQKSRKGEYKKTRGTVRSRY
jgi:hypothetical protein